MLVCGTSFLHNSDRNKAGECSRAVYNRMERPKSMNGAPTIKTKVLRLRLKDKHAKFLRDLAREDVSASALAKTPRAKSVLDAGWSAFRTMLRYKCAFAGATFAEVNEAFSTQTCSACDARSGPKGIAGLGIREWACGE
jgi:putative transposase